MCFSLKCVLQLLGFMCLIMLVDGQDSGLRCGKRKVKTNYLVRGGVEASAGFWPWHVAIYHQGEYMCGGSIIDANTILTASHCVYAEHGVLPKTHVSVHVGRIHLNITSKHTRIHDVHKIFVHPQFSGNSIVHDIAVIKLSSNISMNKYVQPVCLWTMDSKEELIVGRNGTIVGFGLNEQDVVSDQLNEAVIGVLDPVRCIQMDRSVFGTHLTPDMFCGIGQAGVSACNGDSGGGMFFEERGKWFVRGLVSFTPVRDDTDVCDQLKPTTFTDVAKYLDWIKRYIDQRVLIHEDDLYDIDYDEKLRLFNFQSCGTKPSQSEHDDSMWPIPWTGVIEQNSFRALDCTSTLISEWYAVAPAHCFEDDVVDGYIFLGGISTHPYYTCLDRNRMEIKCPNPTQRRHIKNVTKHPKFDRNSYTHNIALIELVTPADTTKPDVKPICMPVTSELSMIATTNLSVPIMYDVTDIKFVPFQYVESIECLRRFRPNRTNSMTLESNQLCAEKVTNIEEERCYDMILGLPFQETKIVNETERYFLRGLDSVGLTCKAKHPNIYMNIEPYVDWILYSMKYHTAETENASEIATDTQTFEKQWITLQQQPGMEKLRFLDMYTCGNSSVLDSVRTVPWIGFLFEDRSFNSARFLAVIISEWRYFVHGQRGHKFRLGNPTFQMMEIKNLIIPPPERHRLTFVLIELLQPVDFKNPQIAPICLPFMKLHQHNSKELVMSSVENFIMANYLFENKHLTIIDRQSCENRLQLKNVPTIRENSTCVIVPRKISRLNHFDPSGRVFQMHVEFGDRPRYFLYGIDANVYEPHVKLSNVYQFDPLEMADVEWIVGNMQENERKTSFPTATRNQKLNFTTVQVPRSKRNLFNFNICGKSSSSYPTPWIGTFVCRSKGTVPKNLPIKPFFTLQSTNLVTLISEQYAVGPAHVKNSCSKGDKSHSNIVIFGHLCFKSIETETEETRIIESCDSPTLRIAVQKIIVHPQYNNINHVNNIALIRLANPVNTSLPYVKPICLPIMDAIRDYDRSSLAVVANDTSLSKHTIINVDNRYVNPTECRERWNGLKANLTIDASNHCVMNQRTSDDECVTIPFGASLQSRQQLISSERHFLRGFAVSVPSLCSYYFPILYQSTDGYLDWMLETMEQPASVPFDLREEHIFS